MTNNKVKSYAERIERLLDERAAIDADIKDIYTEVKAADLKPKVLRKAIANKRRKTDKQFEAEVEEYAALLLALPGATYRGVAEQTGVSKSKLQRLVPKRARGTSTPHNPETGEITETASDTPPSPAPEFGVGPGTNPTGESNDDADGRSEPANGLPASGDEALRAPEPGLGCDSQRGTEAVRLRDGHEEGGREDNKSHGQEAPAIAPPPPNADGMDIPSFLRRSA